MSGYSLRGAETGDVLVRRSSSPVTPDREVVVVKVGRDLLHVQPVGRPQSRVEKFRRSDGQQHSQFSSTACVRTPEQAADAAERAAVKDGLRLLGVRFEGPRQFSTATLRKVRDLLEQED